MSEWPFSSYLGPIGALPTAPRLARGFVFVVLNGWRLLSDRSKVMLEVWDNLPEALGAPAPHHASDDDESGRGLEMVEMLTEDWGWEKVKGWAGKRVWALISAMDKEDF
jgi:hypothetical protein